MSKQYKSVIRTFFSDYLITRYYTIFTISNSIAKTPRDNYFHLSKDSVFSESFLV